MVSEASRMKLFMSENIAAEAIMSMAAVINGRFSEIDMARTGGLAL